ncbi:hypothetical protein DRN69_00885 [Candidatus Pacearchaeota archaeon]|nr:MAG: hypothetical protein DRN69_00885 [Candidatus Pacearchaeota archaeon]
MLTEKQIREIKRHLDKAQNPLFFFDNDLDGLCSFLLLQRYIKRGKGVPLKSFPDMTGDYFRKVEELNADYIFILDKPLVSKEFFEKVQQVNIPVVWIDHHDIDIKEIPKFVYYYNPLLNKDKKNEPVTALCYQVSDSKEDLWIAVIGCIYDKFVPSFYKEFVRDYSDLAINSENAFNIYYNSEIGKIARILNFALKDRTTNVIGMLKFLIKVKTPYEILEESNQNRSIYSRFKQIDSKYQKLLKKAISLMSSGNFFFFQFGGDLSISSDLANELSYRFPEKIIVVAYINGIKANLSIRGKKIREKVLKVIQELNNANGGGHEDAVGAKIMTEDLKKFKESLIKLI